MKVAQRVLTIVFFAALAAVSSALPAGDFLFSRYFEGESNCTTPSPSTYAVFTPLGCFASVGGSGSQLRNCNDTHYVVNECSDDMCSSGCMEVSSLTLNDCDSGTTLRTCEPITEELIPTNAIVKIVWAQPGACDQNDFSSIMIYGQDNECYHTNSSSPEFFDFHCNSSTGELTRSFHSSPWCDGAKRQDQPTNDQICLSTLNDQYSSNTLIGCSISTMLDGLSPSPPTQRVPTAMPQASPIDTTPFRPTSTQPTRLNNSSASIVLPYAALIAILSLL
jgi:hypothetical protein